MINLSRKLPLGLDDADSRAILWDNAAALLGLQVPAIG